MTTKKAVVPLLLILSIVIWSHNIYRVINSVFTSEDESRMEEGLREESDTDYLLKLNEKPREHFVYQANFRDPFKDWLHQKKEREPEKQALKVDIPIQPVRLPQIRFTGLLKDSAGHLAVIEDHLGKIHFIDVQDSVAGVVVTKISEEEIDCIYKEKKFKLKLRR